jgi:hypothetical protein
MWALWLTEQILQTEQRPGNRIQNPHIKRLNDNAVKSYLFFCITNFLVTIGYCQTIEANRLQLIQGIWAGTTNSDVENLYKIVKENKSLGISLSDAGAIADFYLNESIEGFQNFRYSDVDSINVKTLSGDGKYYTVILEEDRVDKEGWVSIAYCIIPDYFECDGELMSINGGRLLEFSKLDQLPFEALMKLYKRGTIDRRDYIKEYLDLNVLSIKTRCKVYSNPNEQTKLQLNKDDIVVVIDGQGNWLKVQYDESGVGWIRKTDVH